MSSSTSKDGNIMACASCSKEGDGSIEKDPTLQIEHLSIEKKESHIATSTNTTNTDDITLACATCGKEGEENNMNICNKCKMAV